LIPPCIPIEIRQSASCFWQMQGGDYCMVVTAAEVSKAKEVAYKRIKGIHIPGGITVRDDIGERLEEQIPGLQKHGYALGV
jgi:phosphoribosylamine-glycine ligase